MKPAKLPHVLIGGAVLLGGLALQSAAHGQGCDPASGRGGCNKLPPGAIPAPAGTSVHAWLDQMSIAAEADDFVVYKHEWYQGGLELGPYGQYHLDQMVHRLAHVPFPVVLQPEATNPAVNEVRRRVLIEGLAKAGVPDAARRVIIAFPKAEGMYGDGAYRIYNGIIGGGGGAGVGGMGTRVNSLGAGTLGGLSPR